MNESSHEISVLVNKFINECLTNIYHQFHKVHVEKKKPTWSRTKQTTRLKLVHVYTSVHTTYQAQLKRNYSAWPQACDGFATKHTQQAHAVACMLVLEPSSFQKKGIQYTHVQHIHTCILALSFPPSTKCVYTIHTCVYTDTCMLVLGPSSFQETCIQYTCTTHLHSHTDSFPLSTKCVYTIHACNTVTLQLTQWHSFPLSTKHTHYTRMQHIHTPTYTLTHTLFLFPQNVHTLYACTVFLFPQNTHYTIHTCTFQLTHQHLQFSSFHKTYTLYTHAAHSHSNLHTDTYNFPLSAKCAYNIHTCTHSDLHTNIYSFPPSTKHTLHYTHMQHIHIPTYTPTLTVFLLPLSVFLSTLCTVPWPKKSTTLTIFSSGCFFFVSASVFALGAMWVTKASKLPFLGVLSSSA